MSYLMGVFVVRWRNLRVNTLTIDCVVEAPVNVCMYMYMYVQHGGLAWLNKGTSLQFLNIPR